MNHNVKHFHFIVISEPYLVDSSLIGIVSMFKSSKNDIHTRNNYNYFDIMTLFQTKLVIYMYKDHKLQLVLLLCEPGNIHAYSNIKSLHMD